MPNNWTLPKIGPQTVIWLALGSHSSRLKGYPITGHGPDTPISAKLRDLLRTFPHNTHPFLGNFSNLTPSYREHYCDPYSISFLSSGSRNVCMYFNIILGEPCHRYNNKSPNPFCREVSEGSIPPFPRKWESACDPLVHSSGGGGGVRDWPIWECLSLVVTQICYCLQLHNI